MRIAVWIVLCLIWGTTWFFIKVGLRDLPPVTFAAARFVLAVSILFPVILVMRLRMPKTRREWRLIALTGFLQFSLNYSAVFWSEQYISSGLASVLQAMITVFGLVLAWFFLPHEKITRLKIFAVAAGFTGVVVIFYDQLRVESTLAFAACCAIVAGAYAAAQASILVKARAGGIEPAVLVCFQMICGLPAIILYALAVEGSPLEHNWTGRAIASVLYLAVLGTIIAFWLYYWLLSKIESNRAMMISLVTPLIAVVIGAGLLGEQLPPTTLFGGILILAATALIALRKKRLPGEEAVMEKGG